MSVKHTDRKGRLWYLHEKLTAKGNRAFFFSMDTVGQVVEVLPGAYEVYENPNAQVFLRKRTAPVILAEELALVDAALARHGEAWQYLSEVKKATITVHEASELGGLDDLYGEFRGRRMLADEKRMSAHYRPMMRFTLADKKTRSFTVERYCFRGRIDGWIFLDGPGALVPLVRKYVKHLGRESFFELC